jgi:hypothetical protein
MAGEELIGDVLERNSRGLTNIFFFLWRYSPISGLGLIRETFVSLQFVNLGQSVGLLG